MKELAQHQSTVEAENTLKAIYGTLHSRFENMIISTSVGSFSIQFPVIKLWEALFSSEEDMANKFGEMKFSVTFSNYPYSSNDNDYGTLGNPIEPSSPINPVLLWGIDTYSE